MAENKGALTAMLIILGFILPGIIYIILETTHVQSYTRTQTEIHDLITENGGLNTEVKNRLQVLSQKGYEIIVYDENKHVYTGYIPYGKEVYVSVKYQYRILDLYRTVQNVTPIRHYERTLK